MTKIKDALISFAAIAFIISLILSAAGDLYVKFGEDIESARGEGVTCYTYKGSLSCVPDEISEL